MDVFRLIWCLAALRSLYQCAPWRPIATRGRSRPTAISTAANATVNTSIRSVCMIDLYIVSPGIGRIPEARWCKRDKASPRLKLASFRNLRRRTDGKFVIVTIARAITNCSSRKFKELNNSHSHCVESDWIPFPRRSLRRRFFAARPNAHPVLTRRLFCRGHYGARIFRATAGARKRARRWLQGP